MELSAVPALVPSVRSDKAVVDTLAPELLRAIVLGVTRAYSSIAGLQPLCITVVGAKDHSGTSSELAFKTCAEGATYHLLGFPDRAPPSGVQAEA